MTTRAAILMTTIVATAMWAGACSDDFAEPLGPTETESVLVISDTALSVSVEVSTQWGSGPSPSPGSTTPAAEANANVAYISLPPGTAPRGVMATISNRRTASIVSVLLVDGGFDPVAVVARAGDVLQIEVQSAEGATLLGYTRTVPGKRPPKVVRTRPPGGKRDVALNSTILIVFSEPIDARTLNDASIQLLRDGVPVDGRLGFQDASHLVVAFTPAALDGATEYQLVVTQSLRDLDGEQLETPVTVEFTTVEATESAGVSRIAFSDWRSISVISADGSNFTRLVDDGGQGWQYMSPAWSPDGSKIAFGSSRDGGWDIYAMNADGSAVTRLTSEAARDDEPAWSPDGTKIAFTSDRDGDFEIHVMHIDGSGVIKLTDHPAQDGNPAWSPDGTRIAFTSDRDGNNELYVMNADGTNTIRLTNVPDEAIHPEWSPDGRTILFTRTEAGQYVMNADGSGLRWLNVHGGGATWSPDGTQIVFSNGNLFVINHLDGSGLRNLNVAGYEPAWGPSGPIVSNPVPRVARILVDASRDGGVWWYPQWAQEGGFNPALDHQGKRLADYLRIRGYDVVELPRPSTITLGLLESYDIVIRASGFGSYTQSEIDAYQAYVNGGGDLLLLGDHMMHLPADELALSFGLEFAGITRGENILTIAVAHPVTWGVANTSYGVGSGLLSYPPSAQILGRLSAGSYLDLNKDDRQDDGEPSAPAVLGVMTHGEGRIVFCGDGNLWHWVPQPLVDNVLEWLRPPGP